MDSAVFVEEVGAIENLFVCFLYFALRGSTLCFRAFKSVKVGSILPL